MDLDDPIAWISGRHFGNQIVRALYICYFGVREPLVQTQVIPYLRELVKGGHEISLLTFEPKSIETGVSATEKIVDQLAQDGIEWHWLRYHKRPSVPATLFDIGNGARFIRNLHKAKGFDILHARSHVPMAMATLTRKMSRLKPKLLFDIRGFMPEEYVDAGVWPEGSVVYRGVKRVEKWLLSVADGFVVLTEKANAILSDAIGDRPIEVIPCCVDLKRFERANADSRNEVRNSLGIGDRFTLAYVGAFGGWYLTKETAEFYKIIKEKWPDTFALVLTQSEPASIGQLLRSGGFSESDFHIAKVPASEIPRYLSAADAAVSFIKPCFSKQASSPTKNAEYLACGLPIIANAGVGDVDMQITEDKTGVILTELSENGYRRAADELDLLLREQPELTARCTTSARDRFDLGSVGGERYRRLYAALMPRC